MEEKSILEEFDENSMSPEEMRELGKLYLFKSDGDMEKRAIGLRLIQKAKDKGDPEAKYYSGRLLLSHDIRPVGKKYTSEELALKLMKEASYGGCIQARAFMNDYCEKRYRREFYDKYKTDINGPLVDFKGKRIKVNRKGLFTPVDAVLEYIDGMNVLTLSVNVVFLNIEDFDNVERFKKAVLGGIAMWSGDYTVFGGQKLRVKVNVTEEERIFDNLIVIPVGDNASEAILSVHSKLISEKKQKRMSQIIQHKRSFATMGIRWSANSLKMIYVLSEGNRFDDYYEISHVVKHEFGHSLGLGDLYESASDNYEGVENGSYPELDSFAVDKKYYNIVMCDHHGPISNNDIEMVVLAFRHNRAQLFQKTRKHQKISKALGKGN